MCHHRKDLSSIPVVLDKHELQFANLKAKLDLRQLIQQFPYIHFPSKPSQASHHLKLLFLQFDRIILFIFHSPNLKFLEFFLLLPQQTLETSLYTLKVVFSSIHSIHP
jgi:hypothetical protein